MFEPTGDLGAIAVVEDVVPHGERGVSSVTTVKLMVAVLELRERLRETLVVMGSRTPKNVAQG